MILFLDFDGVLHSAGTDSVPLFDRLPLLESVLRAVPSTEVVISSSWREELSLDVLQEMFSPDISPRIIGVTPCSKLIHWSKRQQEIEAWLRTNKRQDAAWVALDDCPGWFEPDCPHLIVCEQPLDEAIASELLRRLRGSTG